MDKNQFGHFIFITYRDIGFKVLRVHNLKTAIDFESCVGLMTDLIGKFTKNQVQKSLLPYFAAIGWVKKCHYVNRRFQLKPLLSLSFSLFYLSIHGKSLVENDHAHVGFQFKNFNESSI